jgi:hypothetical protein
MRKAYSIFRLGHACSLNTDAMPSTSSKENMLLWENTLQMRSLKGFTCRQEEEKEGQGLSGSGWCLPEPWSSLTSYMFWVEQKTAST